MITSVNLPTGLDTFGVSRPKQGWQTNRRLSKMKPCTDSFGLGRASTRVACTAVTDFEVAIAHLVLSNLSVGQPHQSEVLVIVSLRKHSVDPGLSYSIGSDSAQGADMQGPDGLSD
jgi:hypothetical protein